MGLWHHRIIDYQDTAVNKENKHFSSLLSETIHFEKCGKLALLSAPYTPSVSHQTYLKSKDNIILAIDGQISNFKSTSMESEDIIDEVIHLYMTYGSEGLYRLGGAFSLVLYDMQKQTSLLYRSFLTGYPLYFVAKNNLLSVSTNPVYLLHRSDVSDRLDEEEMSLIFSLSFSQWNNTVFTDLTELKHGEMVIITPNDIEHKERPLKEIFEVESYSSEAEAIEKYRYKMENAVKESLLPDGEHGIMLSSGMDSSTLAVFASKILHQQDRKLTAYSWTLPDDTLGDESEKIKELCKTLNIPLKLFNGEKYGPFDMLDNLLLLPDTPFINPFWVITEEIYRHAASDGIGGLLNGNYADVLFAGSRNLLVDILKDKKFKLLLTEIYFIIKQAGYRNIHKSPAILGLLRHLLPTYRIKEKYYHAPEWLSGHAKENYEKVYEERQNNIKEEAFKHFSTALSSFQTGYLGMDRYLSGAYGIKRIEPHRNLELLNYSLNFPTYMTYRDGQMKYFAREAMRGLIPESIRIQKRVGNLNLFVQNSYARNKKKVREMLLDDRSVWKQYVNEAWMEDKLNSVDTLTYGDFLVIWLSLNMQQWQKAIKPGGSLYEGKLQSIQPGVVL